MNVENNTDYANYTMQCIVSDDYNNRAGCHESHIHVPPPQQVSLLAAVDRSKVRQYLSLNSRDPRNSQHLQYL